MPARLQRALMRTTRRRVSTSGGERAEAVDELGGEAFELDLALERGEAAVEAEADVEVGDVGLRDEDGDAEVDLRRPFAVVGQLDLAGLQLGDLLVQHVLVELEADLADVAGLLLAEEVAGAADVEVLGGQREAGAEAVEGAEDAEALFGLGGELLARLGHDEGVGAELGAADAAADLVELGEAEHVGALDDQRVGGGDVEAATR